MDVITAIKGRRSIRNFRDAAIESEKVEVLKNALVWAPSAGNLQSRHFYFVFNKEVKEMFVDASLNQTFIGQAPLVVVGCADLRIGTHYQERGVYLYSTQDLACSLENMMLVAHALDLGSVWVGAFDEDDVSEILGLPKYYRPLAIVPVGYPIGVPAPPPRVSKCDAIDEIL